MMKLKFEVQQRPHSDTRIALKPHDHCGLHGILVYDLPKRAAEQMRPGMTVEATIALPDQYPLEGRELDQVDLSEPPERHGWKSALENPPDTARYVLITVRLPHYSDRLSVPEIARFLASMNTWCRVVDQKQIFVGPDKEWVWHELPSPVAT